RQVASAGDLERHVAELTVGVDLERHVFTRLERRDLALQPLRLRVAQVSVARVFVRYAEVHAADGSDPIALLDARPGRGARIRDAHDEHAERVAAAPGAAEAEAERGAVLPLFLALLHPVGALEQLVGIGGLELDRRRLSVAVHPQLDFVARLRLRELAREASGQRAGHLVVFDVRGVDAKADAVDRRNTVSLFQTGLLGRAALGDRRDHQAKS